MSKYLSESVPNKARVHIVDAVKGIAIILMVFGHTEQGAIHRQMWADSSRITYAVSFADHFIYSFHMAAFFFVSGLFLAGSVERRRPSGFVLEKTRTLLYPYILWSLIVFITDPLTLRFRSAGSLPSLHERIMGIVTGDSSWFLITLFATQLLALLLLRLPHWLQMLVAVAASLLIPPEGATILFKPFQFLPFVVAGMWFSANRVRDVQGVSKPVAWSGFLLLLIAQLAAIAYWGYANIWDRIPLGLSGTAMLLLFSQGISGTKLEKALCWFGEASLGIFVLAPFFQGGAREVVVRVLKTSNPFVYLAVITACAATLPAILWFWKDRLHIGWLFQWPSRQLSSQGEREAPERSQVASSR